MVNKWSRDSGQITNEAELRDLPGYPYDRDAGVGIKTEDESDEFNDEISAFLHEKEKNLDECYQQKYSKNTEKEIISMPVNNQKNITPKLIELMRKRNNKK